MTDPQPSNIWRGMVIMFILGIAAVMAVATFPGWALKDFDAPLHFAAFAAITALTVVAFPRVAPSHIFIGLAILGGATELLQFIPGVSRQPSWSDFSFNILGSASMLALVVFLRGRSSR